MNSDSMPPPNVPLKYAAPADWERYKATISELYESMELKDVMNVMETQHGFKASRKMYNTRISKWGLNKRIRDNEYESILKKKRKREDENPGRASKFILHEKLVPEDKIARFQKRKGRDLGDTFTYNDAATPPSLICRTPTPESPFNRSNTALTSQNLPSPISNASVSTFISQPKTPELVGSGFVVESSCSEDIPMGGTSGLALQASPSFSTKNVFFRNQPSSSAFWNAFPPWFTEESLTLPHSCPELHTMQINTTWGSIQSPTLAPSHLRNLSARSILRQVMPTAPLSSSPSLAGLDWWTTYGTFSESRPASRTATGLISQLESYLRNCAQVLDNYADQMEFDTMVSEISCESGCRFCADVGGQPGLRKCLSYQISYRGIHWYNLGAWTAQKLDKVVHAALQLHFNTVSSTQAFLAQLSIYEIWRLNYQGNASEALALSNLAEQEVSLSLGQDHVRSRDAMLDVAASLFESGRVLEAESKLRDCLGGAFEDVHAICRNLTGVTSGEEVVEAVTMGHVSLEWREDGNIFSCSCPEEQPNSEDWCHNGRGHLKGGDISARAFAACLLVAIQRETGRVEILE